MILERCPIDPCNRVKKNQGVTVMKEFRLQKISETFDETIILSIMHQNTYFNVGRYVILLDHPTSLPRLFDRNNPTGTCTANRTLIVRV